MRLVRDHNPGAFAVKVPCLAERCMGPHRMLQLSDALIDLDGPAFQAYYHSSCIPWESNVLITEAAAMLKAARCDKRDCRLCGG